MPPLDIRLREQVGIQGRLFYPQQNLSRLFHNVSISEGYCK